MFKFKSDHSFIIDTVHFGDCYTDFYIAVMGRIRFRRFLVVKIIVIYIGKSMTCAGAPQYFPTVSTTSSRVAILLANPKQRSRKYYASYRIAA